MLFHNMGSKSPMRGHLTIPKNDIYYTNEPPTCLESNFTVTQWWLLIAGSTVLS